MAESYEEWKSFALKLDEETGAQEWKFDNSSPYFDAHFLSLHFTEKISSAAPHFRFDLSFKRRVDLRYCKYWPPYVVCCHTCRHKKLIEDYIEEVSQSLAYIASSECITFQRKEKIEFLKIVKSIWTTCSYVLGEQP